MKDFEIRFATVSDAEKILDIYAPYVTGTAITFEYSVPSLEDFRARIKNISAEYPYLVAVKDGEIVGYAYASKFYGREAYRHVAETSIYIKASENGKGIGKALYAALESILVKQNVFTLYACIAFTDRDDEYLPKASPLFHEHLGYKRIGIHENCGYKFDRWYSVAWYEKSIAPLPAHPGPFVAIGDRSQR